MPFARTRAEREARHDPRPSLEERYGTHAGYVRAVRTAADAAVAQRFLLGRGRRSRDRRGGAQRRARGRRGERPLTSTGTATSRQRLRVALRRGDVDGIAATGGASDTTSKHSQATFWRRAVLRMVSTPRR